MEQQHIADRLRVKQCILIRNMVNVTKKYAMQSHHQSTNVVPKEGHLVQGAPRRLTITRDPGLSCLDLWPAKLFLLSAKELLGPLPFRQHLQKLLNCLDLWSRKDLKVSLFHWWFWLGETFVSWIFEQWWGERAGHKSLRGASVS